MRERIFICTHSQLPRGDANSNYIFHMALSLVNEGFEVIAIGRSKTCRTDIEKIQGVLCINIARNEKLPAKLEGHLLFGAEVCRVLREQSVQKDDYIIMYGGYVSLFRSVANQMRHLAEGHIITCVVEWPTKFQFKRKSFDVDYLLWKYVFYRMMPKWKKVIVISENLRSHFTKIGCTTFLLPPLIDSKSKVAGQKKSLNKVQFIYAGADTQKDAIENMLLAIDEFSEQEKKLFTFHITSLTEKKARKLLGKKQNIIDENLDCLQIHGWMEYKDLINLYYSVDYLLLARETNRFTLSNFPSKVPEMMNYGIIPVCSQVGDYTRIYLNNMTDSIVFEGSSPKNCSDAIRAAICITEKKRKCMSEEAIATAKNSFDYRCWGGKLSEFILH